MRHLHHHLPRLYMRIGENLFQRIDRATPDLERFQSLNPFRRGFGFHHGRECIRHQLAVLDADGVGREARIGQQRFLAKSLAEALKGRVIADREDDIAILGREFLIGRDIGVLIAKARRVFACRQIIHALIGKPGHMRVQHADINLLALPGIVAMVHRRENANAAIKPREKISDRHANLLR